MRLQSAIFDMDGTLLDSMYIWKDLGARVLVDLGVRPRPDLYEHLKVLSLREGAAYCREAYHLQQTQEELVELIESQIRDFYYHEVQAKPGVQKFLSLLKMEGVWMYVATATDRHLAEAALRRTGLDGYFRGILTSQEVGVGKKDSPEIYERCMRRLRSNKKDTVIFEDALHAVRTAKPAGFRVCGVYDSFAPEDQEELRSLCDYYITSFEEMFSTSAPL